MTTKKTQPATTKKPVARKLTVVRTAEEDVVLDGNQQPVADETTKIALTRADKRKAQKQQTKIVAGKQQILDADKVKQIIALADAGSKNSEIAKQFGVASSHISNIIRGVTWTKVTGRSYTKGAYQQYHPQVAEKSAETKKGGK